MIPKFLLQLTRRFMVNSIRLAWSLMLLSQFAGLNGLLAQNPFGQEFREAERAFHSGDYNRSLQRCRRAIDKLPHSQDWPVLKMRVELTTGLYEEAWETLKVARIDHPNSIRVRLMGMDVCRFNDERVAELEMGVEIERLYDRASWRYRDARNQVALGEYLLRQGVDAKKVMDRFFNRAKQDDPELVAAYLATGELALAKKDFEIAAKNYRAARELDGERPDVLQGLARAVRSSDPAAATELLQQALEINPHHIPSLLMQGDFLVRSELYEEARAALDEILRINPRQPSAFAYLATVAHLQNQPEQEAEYRLQALEHYSSNPEVDYLIGKKLAEKYRFAEAARYLQRSLVLDPEYEASRIELAQNELRLGNIQRGWQLASEINSRDPYNVVAHNLVTLRDEMRDYATLSGDLFVVRMDRRESHLYGDRVLQLLQKASRVLTEKYKIEIEGPVYVEIFHRQADFAIRTFGTPGGDGFLGVCFGNVITMNSPAAQGAKLTSWESVLWHEFCHVVTLNKTANKMPRWLSEGISVYEESLANPAWGQSMNPTYRRMILGGDVTPVSELSSAFLRPPSALHLQFAYFQSAMVVEYLVQRYGLETLHRVLDDLRIGMPINESLARYAGSMELLDREFAKYADEKARHYLAEADWSDPDLPEDAGIELLQARLEKNPNNIQLLQRTAAYWIDNDEFDKAISICQQLIQLGYDVPGESHPYLILAQIHRERGDDVQEAAQLEAYLKVEADAGDVLSRLLELSASREEWPKVIRFAERYLGVNPLIALGHRYLATAAEASGDLPAAIHSLEALSVLDPADPADVHFRLARAYYQDGQLVPARRNVLQALEYAPRYLAAHELLREVVPTDNNGVVEDQ